MLTIMVLSLILVSQCHCQTNLTPSDRLSLYKFFMGFGPEMTAVRKISFNPEAGLRFREQYEKKYGAHGSLLIERFGQGIGTEGPSILDIDQILEPSKNKTKHYRTEDFKPASSKTKRVSETDDTSDVSQ